MKKKPLIYMAGNELVKKILGGERDFSGIQLENGFDLNASGVFEQIQAYLDKESERLVPYIDNKCFTRECSALADNEFKFFLSDMTGFKAEGLVLPFIDASYARFCNAKLSRANFHHGEFDQANFTGADLSDASLSWSDLQDAIFNRASMSGADISYSKIGGAKFRRTKMGERLPDIHGAYYPSYECQDNRLWLTGDATAYRWFKVGNDWHIDFEVKGCIPR